MSMRPVDLQSVLHRAGEPQRIDAAAREQPGPGQHHFLQQLQAESQRQQQMVRHSADAEAGKLDTSGQEQKARHENNADQKQRKRKAEQMQDSDRGVHLDIKV